MFCTFFRKNKLQTTYTTDAKIVIIWVIFFGCWIRIHTFFTFSHLLLLFTSRRTVRASAPLATHQRPRQKRPASSTMRLGSVIRDRGGQHHLLCGKGVCPEILYYKCFLFNQPLTNKLNQFWISLRFCRAIRSKNSFLKPKFHL